MKEWKVKNDGWTGEIGLIFTQNRLHQCVDADDVLCQGTPLLAPVVVPVHGIALHAGGLSAAAAATVAEVGIAADSIYWAITDDALLL